MQEKDRLIEQLKNELEESKAQLTRTIQANETYQNESKQLQQFLQNEIKKKDLQIKKVRQQFAKKQKSFGESKSKFNEYEKQLASKNKQIAQLNQKFQKMNSQSSNQNSKIIKLERTIQDSTNQITNKNNIIKEYEDQITNLKNQIEKLKQNENLLKKSLEDKTNQLNQEKQKKSKIQYISTNLNKSKEIDNPMNSNNINSPKGNSTFSNARELQQIKKLKQEIAKLKKKQNAQVNNTNNPQIINNLKIQNQRLVHQLEVMQSETMKTHTLMKSKSRGVIQVMSEPQEFKKLQKAYKQLKIKYNEVIEQKKNLMKSLKQLQKKHNEDRQTIRQQLTQFRKKDKQNIFHILIKTKRHYISPFLEIHPKNIKLLKQTKSGFQKSLGCFKFIPDFISYDINQINSSVVENLSLEQWNQKQQNDTIIIFGPKRTSKKQLFILLVNFLKQKLPKILEEEKQINFKIHFFKTKIGESAQIDQEYGTDHQQYHNIEAILQNILELLQKKQDIVSPRKNKTLNLPKTKSKDQIRFLQINLNQKYKLQIITSNNSGVGFKDNDSLNTSLNTLIFSHIPFEISYKSKRYIILPINPIVQQYETCKLSLLLISQQYKVQIKKEDYTFTERIVNTTTGNMSPVKQQIIINENVRKKLEYIQKQNEQSSIKIKRLQEECVFFRSKIEECMIRIKNIISTQNKQISYLKKSPIILTLEKLQRSMSSILQRNNSVNKTICHDRDRFYQNIQDYNQKDQQEEFRIQQQDVVL